MAPIPPKINYPSMITTCVGCQHHLDTQQKILSDCPVDQDLMAYMETRLFMEQEPDNAYDPNAVRIAYKGDTLGYIPRDKTADVIAFLHESYVEKGLTHQSFEIRDPVVDAKDNLKWFEFEVTIH